MIESDSQKHICRVWVRYANLAKICRKQRPKSSFFLRGGLAPPHPPGMGRGPFRGAGQVHTLQVGCDCVPITVRSTPAVQISAVSAHAAHADLALRPSPFLATRVETTAKRRDCRDGHVLGTCSARCSLRVDGDPTRSFFFGGVSGSRSMRREPRDPER